MFVRRYSCYHAERMACEVEGGREGGKGGRRGLDEEFRVHSHNLIRYLQNASLDALSLHNSSHRDRSLSVVAQDMNITWLVPSAHSYRMCTSPENDL
jgi:hypothetical protein